MVGQDKWSSNLFECLCTPGACCVLEQNLLNLTRNIILVVPCGTIHWKFYNFLKLSTRVSQDKGLSVSCSVDEDRWGEELLAGSLEIR